MALGRCSQTPVGRREHPARLARASCYVRTAYGWETTSGGVELVADAVARLDERVRRGARVDLLAQLADEDVDGAVAVRGAPAPDPLQQLVAGEHAALVERERVDEPELGRRQLGALAVDVRLDVARVEPQLLDR